MHSFGLPNTNCTVEEIDDRIFLLTLKGYDQHLLNPPLIDSLRKALDHVKSCANKTKAKGSVLITTAEGENFCYGFDKYYAQAASSNEDYRDRYIEMINLFRKVVEDLISLPMPTIAAVNGYACGPGLMLALSHDYITIWQHKHLLQLTELDMKMTLPDYCTALIREKVGPGARGRLALRGLKLTAKHAEGMGIVVEKPRDSDEEPVDAAKHRAKELAKKGWDGLVYAETRKSLYPELCDALGLICTPLLPSKL